MHGDKRLRVPPHEPTTPCPVGRKEVGEAGEVGFLEDGGGYATDDVVPSGPGGSDDWLILGDLGSVCLVS